MVVTTRSGPARTFTEAVRLAGEAFLVDLVRHRPDLRDPLPLDLAELTARATTTGSVARAMDGLNAWQRHVMLGLAALPDPASIDGVLALAGEPAEAVRETVAGLRALGLVWGSDDALHLIRAAREQFGSYPAGLAPISPRPLPPADIPGLLAASEPGAHELVDRLVWAPAGSVSGADRPVTVDTARSPVERLLARRLLRPVGHDHVLLPREVALELRGGRLTPEPVDSRPPEITGTTRRARLVDNGAAGAALDLLHDLDVVIRSVDGGPVRLLRDGGLGLRDLSTLAQTIGTDTAHAAFLLEAAAGTGLVVADGPILAVTTAYDRWERDDSVARWRWVATSWATAPRIWSPPDGAHALGTDGELPRFGAVRHLVVDLLLSAGIGTIVDPDSLLDAALWHRPSLRRVGPLPLPEAVAVVQRELAWLGATGLGAASSLAVVLADQGAEVPAAIAGLFPEPVDRVIIQGDLTAVAPGPLAHGPARDLRLLADQESRGTGGVFRFTAASLRRAFDAGWSAADVRSWLDRHSTTGVPQPLAYLVDDVARRHGSIRIGSAGAYLNVADESQVAALLAHPDAATLGLRRIAPGVLVAAADPSELVDWLRRTGHSPTAEDAHGRALTSPGPHRVRAPRRVDRNEAPTPEQATAAILAGSAPVRTNGRSQSTAETLLLLTRATREAVLIQISYVAADGAPVDRTVSPLDLDGGRLRAVDRDGAQVVSIPLARISKVRPVEVGALD